ncbi:hypothetical protein MMC16_001675 [Acarospora aff. strigata]|nr:hypothetical protein [Acarospora aff. strigata]
MAGLQGNGGLSALEATWPAASEIQVEILRYLNVQDIWNLRKTNKNMNRLFMGPARPGVGNTILHYLGAHCNEIRGYTPCVNGPRSDVRMQYCQGQELLNTGVHGPNQGGSHNRRMLIPRATTVALAEAGVEMAGNVMTVAIRNGIASTKKAWTEKWSLGDTETR